MNISPSDTTVLLLAAGHGKRMLPLTKDTPKPLLKVNQHSLIEHHLLNLSRAGFRDIVINVAYLSENIIDSLGDGSRYGVTIEFSDESNTGALETAGGIKNALPLIKSDPFIAVNADIWTDFEFSKLLNDVPEHGRLVMVENPSHNKKGDFGIDSNGLLIEDADDESLTYSGIAIYRKKIFDDIALSKSALAPLFRQLIGKRFLHGTRLTGEWFDIGTPDRLRELRAKVNSQKKNLD